MDGRICLLAGLLLLPAAVNASGDGPLDRATLKGLKTVGAVIDTIDPELEKLGVTRDVLLSRMLGRLGSDNVTVDPNANEFLGLRITAVRAGHGPFAVSMTLGLYQPVLLSRNHEIRTSTQTWEVETILLADPKILLPACSDSAADLIDHFANAFHAINPE
jgi:hypothetical protein